jgi:hypothetical protein
MDSTASARPSRPLGRNGTLEASLTSDLNPILAESSSMLHAAQTRAALPYFRATLTSPSARS